ncbi:MAG: hypothetical protein GPOALKHO_001530 [Sodalis sp.]|nr:MAG: hypothetical protein GPOALKHO_001530 [Sodalis sp.]
MRFTDTSLAASAAFWVSLLVLRVTGFPAEDSTVRGAANDLRNRAAAMGRNGIYGATSPVSKSNLSVQLVPLNK